MEYFRKGSDFDVFVITRIYRCCVKESNLIDQTLDPSQTESKLFEIEIVF